MKEVQKYIVLMLVLAIVGFLIPPLRAVYIDSIYGVSEIPLSVKAHSKIIIPLAMSLQNIAAAIWLLAVSKREDLNRWIWSIFGLVSGLIAVVIFYLLRINKNLNEQ